MNLLGNRLVLDQFQYVIAKHHGPLGGAQVFANLKRVHVDLARHSAVVHQVLGQVRQTIEQAFTAGFKEPFHGGRVSGRVGR